MIFFLLFVDQFPSKIFITASDAQHDVIHFRCCNLKSDKVVIYCHFFLSSLRCQYVNVTVAMSEFINAGTREVKKKLLNCKKVLKNGY